MKAVYSLCLVIFVWGMGREVAWAQSMPDSIELKLQWVNVEMERYDSIYRDSIPVYLSCSMYVINHSQRGAVFGCASRWGEGDTYLPVGGRMFLLDGQDCLEFYGTPPGGRSLFWIHPKDTIHISGLLNLSESSCYIDPITSSSKSFMDRYAQKKEDYRQFLCHYFRKGIWVYIPIVEDYKKYLHSENGRRFFTKPFYPTRPIVASFDNPWAVFIFEMTGECAVQDFKNMDAYMMFPDSIVGPVKVNVGR